LRQVAAHVGSLEYDPRCGSFRGWLFTIVRNKLRDFHDQPRRLHQGSGDSGVQRLLENQAAPEAGEAGEWAPQGSRVCAAAPARLVIATPARETWCGAVVRVGL
jgi:DNA-directed RNA polymerase specialized sigma24 family protein